MQLLYRKEKKKLKKIPQISVLYMTCNKIHKEIYKVLCEYIARACGTVLGVRTGSKVHLKNSLIQSLKEVLESARRREEQAGRMMGAKRLGTKDNG